MFGLLNVNKPTGLTSHDVVAAIRRLLPRKTKVGHAGTLDPFACGVLVVCIGPATRLAEYAQRTPKRYQAEFTLGATSTTDDSEGEITAFPTSASAPDRETLARVIGEFVGAIQQVPPAHSAVHVNGQRAYKLARAGQATNLQARQVVIETIDILAYEYPRLSLDIACGSGTYIRALARDIGAKLNTGGYCSQLVRTAVGPCTLGSAVELSHLDIARDLLSPLTVLTSLPQVIADEAQRERLAQGKWIPLPSELEGNEAAVIDCEGNLLAIARIDRQGAMLKPSKVFPPAMR